MKFHDELRRRQPAGGAEAGAAATPAAAEQTRHQEDARHIHRPEVEPGRGGGVAGGEGVQLEGAAAPARAGTPAVHSVADAAGARARPRRRQAPLQPGARAAQHLRVQNHFSVRTAENPAESPREGGGIVIARERVSEGGGRDRSEDEDSSCC